MKKRILISSLTVILLLSFFAPQAWAWGWNRQGKVVSPEGELKEIEWNEWELVKDPIKRDVAKSPMASCHIFRLQTAEPAHTHDSHELIAVILKGTGKVHFDDQTFSIQKGDVTHIPAGVPHWVENTGTEPLEAYAVFIPPYDGKDFHPISGRRQPLNPPVNSYENG